MGATCPETNTEDIDQTAFWDENGIHWDAHRIGWAVAGAAAAITVIISLINIFRHCRNYHKPAEQRQIIRILLMPPVYAVISFFSYRYFRSYTYYELAETAYESITLSAFLLLLIEYVASTASGHSADNALMRKDKKALPFPFGYWRYRPTKAYFMYTLKWSVLQYVIIRPLLSIVGIICEAYGVLCQSAGYNFHWASVYISIIDFISISFALYGLIVFYGLTKDELVGRRPLAKFLSIKLIVMFTFYQTFVFDMLEGRVIKSTDYWTETNIADGLNALCVCLEMIVFSGMMMWAYSSNEYKTPGAPRTSIWRPLWDCINYSDFAYEIYTSFRFFFAYMRNEPNTHGVRQVALPDSKLAPTKMTFGEAFGVEGHTHARLVPPASPSADGFVGAGHRPGQSSYDEDIRLQPYPVAGAGRGASPPARPSASIDGSGRGR